VFDCEEILMWPSRENVMFCLFVLLSFTFMDCCHKWLVLPLQLLDYTLWSWAQFCLGNTVSFGVWTPVGRDLPHLSRPFLRPSKPPVKWVLGLLSRGKVTQAWCWTPIPVLCQSCEWVELYLYSPSVSWWHGMEWPLALPVSIFAHKLTIFYLSVTLHL
jgi:hypothetical protein